jgi:hypothetical protein
MQSEPNLEPAVFQHETCEKYIQSRVTEDEVVEFCLSISRGEVENGIAVTEWVYPRLKSVI